MNIDYIVPDYMKVIDFKYDCGTATLEATNKKFLGLLAQNKSIAVGCPFLLDFEKQSDIEELAFTAMTGGQKKLYIDWKAGKAALPPHNWVWTEPFADNTAKQDFESSSIMEAMRMLHPGIIISPEQGKAFLSRADVRSKAVFGALRVFVRAKRASMAGYSKSDAKTGIEQLACSKLRKIFSKRHQKAIPTSDPNVAIIQNIMGLLDNRISVLQPPGHPGHPVPPPAPAPVAQG